MALELAERHGVRPVLNRALKRFAKGLVPQAIMDELELFARKNARVNLRLTAELISAVETLAKNGVSALPFKGPTLAALGYGNVALREFFDLDILIERRDLPAASKSLKLLGYHPQPNLADGIIQEGGAFLDSYKVLAFAHTTSGCVIELHWELSPGYLPFAMTLADLRERAVKCDPAGRPMTTFCPEDLVLYLCVHGAKHHWKCLCWIADIAWLLRTCSPIGWEMLLKQARLQRSERMLWLGLWLTVMLLDIDLPAEAVELMKKDMAARKLALQVCDWISRDAGGGSPPGVAARLGFFRKLRDGRLDGLRTMFNLIATPNIADWEFLRLPPALSFLYPLVRPLRILSGR